MKLPIAIVWHAFFEKKWQTRTHGAEKKEQNQQHIKDDNNKKEKGETTKSSSSSIRMNFFRIRCDVRNFLIIQIIL